MNETIGPVYISDGEEVGTYAKPYSKSLEGIIDKEARKIITTAYERTEDLLKKNRDKLEKLAEALLVKETLNYDQVVELIGPPVYDAAKRIVDPVEFEHSLRNLSTDDKDK